MAALAGAELKPVTIRAWDLYVQSADAAMQARVQPGSSFLWADEAPGRRSELRAGEILVAQVGERNPRKVPSGLIHHWIGTAFIPNTNIGAVFGVVRDYAHYKDYYHPTVLDSRSLRQSSAADRYSMVVMNKSMFLKKALENDFESSFTQVSSQKWYSVATAVRVEEIEDFGQSGEHKLSSGEGSGYVWRLHSITRYEEADGGVYIEIEAMALSRDIPSTLRWVVSPIVRRVSKSAMQVSLRQTQDAVGSYGHMREGHPADTPGFASGFLKPSQH